MKKTRPSGKKTLKKRKERRRKNPAFPGILKESDFLKMARSAVFAGIMAPATDTERYVLTLLLPLFFEHVVKPIAAAVPEAETTGKDSNPPEAKH